MSGSRRRVGLAIVVALAAFGCAKKEAPGGGPPDLVPPHVVSSDPDSGAAQVPLDARLSVTFSEAMEPRSAGDAIALAPYVEISRRRWHRRTVTLELAERLRPDHIYTMFVGAGARDRHGNSAAKGTSIVFSTGDSFPRGRIAGQIEPRGYPGFGTYLWTYHASRPGPDSTARDFDALGQADRSNQFQVDGLRVPGRYRMWAFADLNNNRSFEPAVDILMSIDSTLELSHERPAVSGLIVPVLNPRAPGRVRGAVIDSTVNLQGALRIVAVSEKDSTRRLLFEAGTAGAFDFQLDAGGWTLRAFRDLDGNKSWQPETEPASLPLMLQIGPADDVAEIKLEVRPAGGG